MEEQIAYLEKMTDDFGIIQFSNNSSPDINSGYTLDDVSRALIVSTKLEKTYPRLEKLTRIYLDFIKNAQTENAGFINIFGGSRKPLEEIGSPDSFARTLWALGEYFLVKEDSEEIILKALGYLEKNPLKYPISESFALLGLSKFYESGVEKQKIKELVGRISNSLIEKVKKNCDSDWFWPSNEMSYENGRIPQALFNSYNILKNIKYLIYAENLTNFLDQNVFREKQGKVILSVVGNNGDGKRGSWYKKGGKKPEYDEQPVDIGAMVELHIDAYKIKNKNKYHLDRAEKSMKWFSGANRLNKKMISLEGGVYDGLGKDDVNYNQGAESLLAYMMAKINFNNSK